VREVTNGWIAIMVGIAAVALVTWRRRRLQPFDPSELVALAREQCPERARLADALARSTQALVATRYNVYFVDNTKPNEPGSEWQFAENVVLESPVDGDVILDVLKDGRIGSLEYLGRKLRDGQY
jgi:hypothetical protein